MSNYSVHILRLVPAAAFIFWCLATATIPARGAGGPSPLPAAAQHPSEALRLEKGKAVERALSVGEVQRFNLELAAGQKVSVQFKRYGVPLVATLFGPDGREIDRLGGSYAKEGEETMTFLTMKAGTYRFEVRTFFSSNPPGHYQVKLVDSSAATYKEEEHLSRQSTNESCQERNWLDGQGALEVKLILTSIADCMSAVADNLKASHPEAGKVAAFTKAEVGFLNSRWHWGEPISAAYQKNLISDFKALAFAAGDKDKQKAFAILREVADDVKIKAKHCSKSTRGLGKDVTVSVTTKKRQKEDPGWVVYYMLRIYEFTRGQNAERFPKLSSPSLQDLPPGKYLMWLGAPGQSAGPQSQKQVIDVGDGKSRIDWDLFTP